MKQENEIPKSTTKGIIKGNSRNPSKESRISWGEVKINLFQNFAPLDNRTIEELDSTNLKQYESSLEEEKLSKNKENIE